MNKGSLGIHKVKLPANVVPSLLYCSSVDKAGNSSLNFSQISTRNNSRGLIVDSNLFTGQG